MFWSLLLEPGKRYTKVVDSPFHISAAVLDTSSHENGIVRVIVDIGDTEALIANLSLSHGILQFPLDLRFDSGSRISFYTSGAKINVHLSGYVTYDEEIFSEDEDDKSSDEEEVPTLINVSAKRKPEESPLAGNKKAKLQKASPKTAAEDKVSPTKPNKKANDILMMKQQEAVDSDEDGLDDSDEGEEVEEEEEDEDEMEEEEEEEESDEDESEEDESEEDETEMVMVNQQKKANNVAAKQDVFPTKAAVNVFKVEKNPKGAKTPGNEGANTPKAPKTPKGAKTSGNEGAKTPGGDGGVSNKSKKTPNKPQGANTAATQNGKTPKSETPAKDGNKSPKTPKLVKPGGVVCEDIVVGKGPEAKNGKMVAVYYCGRLVSNKKMFDKCDSGKGFKFRLGGGEVIKGWDVGVSGMKIGGKRKIICPPHMAYGKKGAPPDIPGNSALSFVVELKGIS